MAPRTDSGQAFPGPRPDRMNAGGMSLRDYFDAVVSEEGLTIRYGRR